MRNTAPTKAVVAVVWERDQGSCASCRRPLVLENRGVGWSVHHRVNRGTGGSRAPWINLPSNLIAVCGSGVTGCHWGFESNRLHAEAHGFVVRRGIRTPAEIPIQHALHGLVYLNDDGTTTPA